MNALHRRIIDISYKKKLSHLGSCLTAVDIIDKIYHEMSEDDIFVLSSGHAALALYVVLEKYKGIDAEMLFDKHGVHPNRDVENFIYCSAGSLGNGLPIALGMALADRSRMVYCLVSDGEMAEGSIWEALRVKCEQNVDNLIIHGNFNGWGAYNPIDRDALIDRVRSFDKSFIIHLTELPKWSFIVDDQEYHYKALNEKEYAEAIL